MWSKSHLIDPIVIIALIIGWVLVLLPSLTPPAAGGLDLARIVEKEQNYEVRFGILDWAPGRNGLGPSRSQSAYSRQRTGYRAIFSFPLESTDEERDYFIGPRSYSVYAVNEDDTEALVLFPVTLGLLAVALIFYIPGAVKRSGAWLGLSALFAFVASALGWTAWGFAYTLTDKIRSNMNRYYDRPQRAWDPIVERGNVIWPGLVGVILITIAAILVLVKLLIRPKDNKRVEQQELATLGTKGRERNTSMSSDETLANP